MFDLNVKIKEKQINAGENGKRGCVFHAERLTISPN